MPNNFSQTSSDKEFNRSTASGASKVAQRVEQTVDRAAGVAAEAASQVRDQSSSASMSSQSKSAGSHQEPKHTDAKSSLERVADTARDAVSSAKDVLTHAQDETGTMLHNARDVVADSYGSAREYALDVAHDASDMAQRAGQQTARYARRARRATGSFVSVHALPLTFLGASLGWLVWSMRQQSRRSPALEVSPTRLQATLESRRPPIRESHDRAALSAATTSGAKLMGVRTQDVGYEE